jgi:hypothetical protein
VLFDFSIKRWKKNSENLKRNLHLQIIIIHIIIHIEVEEKGADIRRSDEIICQKKGIFKLVGKIFTKNKGYIRKSKEVIHKK